MVEPLVELMLVDVLALVLDVLVDLDVLEVEVD